MYYTYINKKGRLVVFTPISIIENECGDKYFMFKLKGKVKYHLCRNCSGPYETEPNCDIKGIYSTNNGTGQ